MVTLSFMRRAFGRKIEADQQRIGTRAMPGRARCTPSVGSGMPQAAETSATAETARSPWTEIEVHLERARRSILAEIRNYPPPIAGCDQQFNHLLEQRDRIARDLRRLAALRRYHPASETDLKALIDVINASEGIAPELKAPLVQLANQRLGEPT